ncbi:molybdopterin molybdenumtransferase [Oxobacter pfennigii]|uniref:Molybdopterin molybdenumtransferase n=1 Tax=Oxobacter pfennigii TaxID=36849 RepID=A0A0P8W6J8_9CLOT|nr:gephyrin-like molybdotransferase Glp [Oxobacter pfennigii]KPU43373.1 molybdopterin molybdenumtransferase [Oxobacter pfennigii]
MKEFVKLEEAYEIIQKQVRVVQSECAELSEALGRVLYEDVKSPMNFPPFDRSPLDGYALRSVDTTGASADAPVKIKVIEEVPAGSQSQSIVGKDQAVKILTGAPIPKGADAVIRFEDVKEGGSFIEIFKPLKSSENICFAGEDIALDETLIEAGVMLEPAAIGALASLGISEAKVYKKPAIGILSTGDELIEITEPLKPAKIYNSNLYNLTSHLKQMGCNVINGGIATDSCDMISRKISDILPQVDILITTGGVSVGDYDAVKDSLIKIGADILFWRVDIRPGTPMVCSIKDNKLILSLSGNPSASIITYLLLAVPAIKKAMGMKSAEHIITPAVLEDNFKKTSPQRRMLRCRSFIEEGILKVTLTGNQSPGIIKSLMGCNTIIDVPAGSGPLKKGDKVKVILL